MMNPLNVTPQNRKGEKTNDITHQSVFFPPKSGELIVWRSYLMHGIQPKIQECKRIVFTYNFGRK